MKGVTHTPPPMWHWIWTILSSCFHYYFSFLKKRESPKAASSRTTDGTPPTQSSRASESKRPSSSLSATTDRQNWTIFTTLLNYTQTQTFSRARKLPRLQLSFCVTKPYFDGYEKWLPWTYDLWLFVGYFFVHWSNCLLLGIASWPPPNCLGQ